MLSAQVPRCFTAITLLPVTGGLHPCFVLGDTDVAAAIVVVRVVAGCKVPDEFFYPDIGEENNTSYPKLP